MVGCSSPSYSLMVSWDIFVELNIGFQISFRLESICGDIVSAPGGSKCFLELLSMLN